MTSPETQAALDMLLRDKLHVRPGALARLPSSQTGQLNGPLALARLLMQPLRSCPAPFVSFWATHPAGHAVIDPQRHGYQPGRQAVGRRVLEGVAWVSARRLLAEPGLALPVAHLLDHLLGSDGQPGGVWLSDGAGRTPAWAEIGWRLQRQFSLGYAPAEARADAHAYFAWGLRAYLADRQALNAADPGLERLLAGSLFEQRFWLST